MGKLNVFQKDKPVFPRFPDARIIYNENLGSNYNGSRGRGVVVEFPPAIRPILEDMAGVGQPFLHQLAFPYVYLGFLLVKDEVWCVYLFYRNTKLTDQDRELCYPNLPNMRGDCSVCMVRSSAKLGEPLEEWVGRLIEDFWSSVFSNELMALWEDYEGRPYFPFSFSNWEYKSHKDPAFITRLPWISAYTFEFLIERMRRAW